MGGDRMQKISYQSKASSLTLRLGLATGLIVALVMGFGILTNQAGAATQTVEPQSKACDWFGVCGHFNNHGSVSIKATCDWNNKNGTAFWVPKGKKSTSYCRDTDGVYVPAGKKIQHRYPETMWTDKFKTTGWHKISDSFTGQLRQVNR